MKSIGMFFSLLVLGFALQYLGGKSNEFVMSQNGGRMPVWCIMEDMRLGAMFDPRHTVMDKDTEYPYLADYIVVPFIHGFSLGVDIESPGDVMLDLGSLTIVSLYLFPFFLAGRWLRRKRNEKTVL